MSIYRAGRASASDRWMKEVAHPSRDPSVPDGEHRISQQLFFGQASSAFARAVQRLGQTHYYIQIADNVMRLQFAGTALAPNIVTAFSHLLVAPIEQPDLTVCLWDVATSGVPLPPYPDDSSELGSRGQIGGYNNSDLLALFFVNVGMLTLFMPERGLAFVGVEDAAVLPVHITVAPLRDIIHRWQAAKGRQMVHAAAVGEADGGVLLVGKGGSGKSTSTLACLESDLLYAGDDYLLLSEQPQPFIHSLYNSAKINPHKLLLPPRLAALAGAARSHYKDKAVFYLSEDAPDKLSTGFPLRAIVLPSPNGRENSLLRPIAHAIALVALAPSTIMQLTGANQADFSRLTAILSRIPTYVLEAGTDLTGIPLVLKALLEKGAA